MTDVAALVRRFYDELWNAWDDDIASVLHPTLRFRGSLGQEQVGLDQWRAYRDGVRRGSPDFRNEIVDLVAGQERAAARLRWSGTHSGPLLGIAATGRSFSYDGAAFFHVRDGWLAEIWVVGDLDGLRVQLT